MHTYYSLLLPAIYQYSSIDFTTYTKSTGGAEYFSRMTTAASSLGIHTTTVSPSKRYKSMTRRMVETRRDNIHATVGSITITLNPHHRSVEYRSWFHLLSATGGECKRRAIGLSKDLNEIFRRQHSRCVCPPPFVSHKSVSGLASS